MIHPRYSQANPLGLREPPWEKPFRKYDWIDHGRLARAASDEEVAEVLGGGEHTPIRDAHKGGADAAQAACECPTCGAKHTRQGGTR